jgi:myb proto-oncogene protein
MLPGRTDALCRSRWVKSLDPDINRDEWTVEEDAKLTNAVKEHGGSNWAAVAVMVPGRMDKQYRSRWAKTVDPTIEHAGGKWSVEEDAKLTDAVKEHSGSNLIRVAALVPGRTNKQCGQRWATNLDPTKEHMVVDG